LCRNEFRTGLNILIIAHSRNKSGDSVLEEVAKGIKKNRWGDSVLEEAQTRNRNGDSVPEKAV
jgi:hypothetical protein